MKKTREEVEQIAEVVVDAMLKEHRALGPGLLESAYQACLAHEPRCRGIEVACEVALPVGTARSKLRSVIASTCLWPSASSSRIMSRSVVLLRALGAVAVNLASPRRRKHHVEREPHRCRRAGPTPIRHVHP